MPEHGGLNPALFRPEAVSADTRRFDAELEATFAQTPPINLLPPQQIRDAREAGSGTFGPFVLSDMAKAAAVPGPRKDVPVRLFVPATVRGVYLHIHGGGWVLGRAHHQDQRLAAIANTCQVAVVSVDYRLAPDHRYPAGPDDCEAVAVWLAKQARAEFGSDRLLIGGESAGGNLAAVTLPRLRDRHGFTGFAGAQLAFGVFDLSMTPSQRRWGDRYLVLNTPIMDWFYDLYVSAERRRDPDVSPLYADLTGMPPALFTVGTADLLLDDTLFMHARWIAAGNEAELAVYPGGVHGFTGFPHALADEANARIDAFIRRVVA